MFKTILKNQLKQQAPLIESNLIAHVQDLIEQTAKQAKIEPVGLSLVFKVDEGLLVAQVVDAQGGKVGVFDAGAVFKDMFKLQLQDLPSSIEEQILANLNGLPVDQILIEALGEDYLLIRPNREGELELYEITAKESKKISVQDYLENIEL